MPNQQNILGQPVGVLVPRWVAPKFPAYEAMEGRLCSIEPLVPDRDSITLYEANSLDKEGKMWTYLPYGPFASFELYRSWLRVSVLTSDPQFYAIIDKSTQKAIGVAAYLRIDPKNGSIEVGHLNFSPLMQKTAIATEAMFLMMQRAFNLGYRRYEWKCNALNKPSRLAAQRLGLSYEGVFRNATVSKGRNRILHGMQRLMKNGQPYKQLLSSGLSHKTLMRKDNKKCRYPRSPKILLKIGAKS
jgi:RimJ/RimL family protein N-acetyltransferase